MPNPEAFATREILVHSQPLLCRLPVTSTAMWGNLICSEDSSLSLSLPHEGGASIVVVTVSGMWHCTLDGWMEQERVAFPWAVSLSRGPLQVAIVSGISTFHRCLPSFLPCPFPTPSSLSSDSEMPATFSALVFSIPLFYTKTSVMQCGFPTLQASYLKRYLLYRNFSC